MCVCVCVCMCVYYLYMYVYVYPVYPAPSTDKQDTQQINATANATAATTTANHNDNGSDNYNKNYSNSTQYFFNYRYVLPCVLLLANNMCMMFSRSTCAVLCNGATVTDFNTITCTGCTTGVSNQRNALCIQARAKKNRTPHTQHACQVPNGNI